MTCYETYKVENLVSSNDNCWCQNRLINLIMFMFSLVLLNTEMFQVKIAECILLNLNWN